jgi:hypothetical protein
VATDYGGAGGGQVWPSPTEPPSPQPPSPDEERPSRSGPDLPARSRRVRFLAAGALGLGLLGLAGSAVGVAVQLLPRKFSASQREQITDWEYGQRWRALAAGEIFPAEAGYVPPASLYDDHGLKLGVHRAGIARPAPCRAATDPAAAAVLDHDGCAAVLRATYVDKTSSYVVTVGVAVLPGAAQAAAAAQELARDAGPGGLGPTVHPVPFAGTPAAWFTGPRRQLSGVAAAGTYVVLYAVGYTDPRPAEPVAGDGYTDHEMTSAGLGTARAVLAALAAPVPGPHCPGTPGC